MNDLGVVGTGEPDPWAPVEPLTPVANRRKNRAVVPRAVVPRAVVAVGVPAVAVPVAVAGRGVVDCGTEVDPVVCFKQH